MKALIVCNGFPPEPSLLAEELQKADLVIGADGGANTLLSMDLKPDLVVGDLDSFIQPAEPAFEVLHDPDQETNDLEKALQAALDRNHDQCVVLGAFGLRMDHSLKNLSVLQQFNPHFSELLFKDNHQLCFMAGASFTMKAEKGTTVSLFPVSGKAEGVTTRGLKYALNNETLENGERDGTSNETTDPEFSVEVKKGELAVFISY